MSKLKTAILLEKSLKLNIKGNLGLKMIEKLDMKIRCESCGREKSSVGLGCMNSSCKRCLMYNKQLQEKLETLKEAGLLND